MVGSEWDGVSVKLVVAVAPDSASSQVTMARVKLEVKTASKCV